MSTVGQLFTNLLKIHPHKSDLWIMAATWEMESRLSMSNARSILQRALRFNPEDKLLWVEYFRMELLNVEKLRKREEVLGIDDATKDEANSAIHNAEIARVVYKNAVEKIPDVDFCVSFLPVCMSFDFANHLLDEIFADLNGRFSNQERALAVMAKRPLIELDQLENKTDLVDADKKWQFISQSFSLFEAAVQRLPTERMWDLFLENCVVVIRMTLEDDDLSEKLIEQSHRAFQSAADQQRLSEQYAVEWVNMLLEAGQLDSAVESCRLSVSLHTGSSLVWLRWIKLLMIINYDNILDEINKALGALQKAEGADVLWKLVLEWCVVNKPDCVVQLFERGVGSKSKAVCLYVKQCYMDWAATHLDIKAIRKLYKKLMAIPPVSIDIFHKYIAAELSQVKPKIKRVRQAYDSMLLLFGSTDIDLWLSYIAMEMGEAGGQPELVGQLYWKAKKALQSSLQEDFDSSYTRLNN